MADILDTAVSWLNGVRKSSMSRLITYGRGTQSVQISATLGSSLLKLDSEFAERIERTEGDVVFSAADLVLSGQATEPQRGDWWTTTFAGVTARFEVRGPGNEPPWRWSDSHRVVYRVHSKQVA